MADYNLVQFVFDREGLSVGEDVAVMTCHIRQTVQAAPDILPITDEGRDDFVGDVSNWWGIVKGHVTQHVSFREMRFYDVPSQAGQDMGDPVRVQGVALPGTGTSGALPPQVSLSITFKTDKRATWGRFYLPGIDRASCDDKGRVMTSVLDEICGATHALTRRDETGAALVVFSRKQWTHHDPQQIQVDDVYDVIRTRRYRQPHYRAQLSAG